MATKLKDFHQTGVDVLVQIRATLQQYLAEIQTDQEPDPLTPPHYPSLLLAKARNKEWSDWLDRYDADIKKLRDGLADESLSAAELEALAERLRNLQIKRKGTLSLINRETELIAQLERSADFIGAQLQTVASKLSAAEQELADALETEERNTAWTETIDRVVSDSPDAPAELGWLKTIKDDATAALNDADGAYKTAQARVEADIPEAVRFRALERSANVWELEADAEDALVALEDKVDAKNKADNGVAGAIGEKLGAYEQAQQVLAELMTNAKVSYDIALAMLQAIVDSEPIGAAQFERVSQLVAAALAVTPAEDIVFAKEQERNEKRREVEEKQLELLAAEAVVRADDPDIEDADLANDASVKPLRDALGDDSGGLLKELQDAEDALGFAAFQELREEELALQQAVAAFAEAKAAFLRDHPEADPELDPDPAIAVPRDERDAQQAVVTVKADELLQTAWYQLEEMEIAVPDRIWNNFKQLHAAERRLQRLADLPSDLTTLKDQLDDAEEQLVGALETDSASDRGFDVLVEEIEKLSARARWLAEQRETRLFDAARGID